MNSPEISKTPTAEISSLVKIAEDNLKRQIDWIGRYDTRSGFIGGIAIGMLGALASGTPALSKWTTGLYWSVGGSLVCLGCTLAAIFWSQFPRTKAPNRSLIFFATIAMLQPDEFASRFKALDQGAYLDDLIAQTHVNAVVVEKKFRALKVSLLLVLYAAVPWTLALYLSRSMPS